LYRLVDNKDYIDEVSKQASKQVSNCSMHKCQTHLR